jgi:pyridoxal phosphate enzyme (YggS family)
MHDIANQLARVRETIAATAQNAGRKPTDIKLIAVSKTHPVTSLQTAINAGQRAFGENTIQESLGKISHFSTQGIEWHFIGHLQSNKAKHLPGNFSWWHSLDSIKLAQRVARAAQEQNTVMNTLVEVNISQDPKKHGIVASDVYPLIERLLDDDLSWLRLRGLMTIGPYPASEREVRATYAALRALRDECVQRFGLPNFTELSMGMSGDYVEAIKEGATLLRIGDAIFGARDYTT